MVCTEMFRSLCVITRGVLFCNSHVKTSSCLYLELTLLRFLSDAPDDNSLPGDIVQAVEALTSGRTSLTGNGAKDRIADELYTRKVTPRKNASKTSEEAILWLQ